MKLLFCSKCKDVFSISFDEKSCHCGCVKGKYLDSLYAVYSGECAIPIGFVNSSFLTALKNQPVNGLGESFKAFVIPKSCETFVKVDEKNT